MATMLHGAKVNVDGVGLVNFRCATRGEANRVRRVVELFASVSPRASIETVARLVKYAKACEGRKASEIVAGFRR
jgi:hypothetical protein